MTRGMLASALTALAFFLIGLLIVHLTPEDAGRKTK